MSECQHAGDHHSEDIITVWHGRPLPSKICGYHLSWGPIDWSLMTAP